MARSKHSKEENNEKISSSRSERKRRSSKSNKQRLRFNDEEQKQNSDRDSQEDMKKFENNFKTENGQWNDENVECEEDDNNSNKNLVHPVDVEDFGSTHLRNGTIYIDKINNMNKNEKKNKIDVKKILSDYLHKGVDEKDDEEDLFGDRSDVPQTFEQQLQYIRHHLDVK
ncbi:hypothetical protein SNEBB_009557 [Seison nebaliae]|nr:hypothetical protein SNEBB_009557 [Seison nebaliae]